MAFAIFSAASARSAWLGAHLTARAAVVQRLDSPIVLCPQEEPVGELGVRKAAALDPCGHRLGQPRQIASVPLRGGDWWRHRGRFITNS
jgi:hypothetical protein